MKKCGSCFYFKHKYPVLDAEFCCQELGTMSEDNSCGDFRRGKHAESATPEIILNDARDALNSEQKISFNISQKENLFNIISDIFTIEQDVDLVIDKIKLEIEKQGYNLPFSANTILRFSSKLSDLFLLYRMTLSYGMGRYIDDIMKLEIEKHFTDPRKYQGPPEATSKTKEI